MSVGTFDISRVQDPAVRSALQRIREQFDVYRGLSGNPLDAVVTLQAMVDGGLATVDVATLRQATRSGGGAGTAVVPTAAGAAAYNPTPPAALAGLVATTGGGFLLLDWAAPLGDPLYAHTEVWRATTDDIGVAQPLGTAVVGVYSDVTASPGTTYYYWVRAVSPDGVAGPYNAIPGTPGVAGLSPADPDSLQGQLSETHLAVALNSRIDQVDAPTTGLVDKMTQAESDLTAHANSLTNLDGRVTSAEGSITSQASDISALQTTVNDPSTGVGANASAITGLDTRVTANEGDLAVQTSRIDSLSAQVYSFDPDSGTTWNFDAGVDGFTAVNGTLTAPTAGTAVLDSPGANTQLISPVFSHLATDVNVVALRVRRTAGAGAWNGTFYFKRTTDTTWDPLRSFAAPEPATWGTNEWGVVRVAFASHAEWGGTIEQVRVDLADTTAWAAEVDWAGVLLDADSAQANALAALDTRVTSAEGGITSQASDISALQTTVNDPSTGVGANASAITGLDTRVTSAEGSITSQASDISALQTTVNDPSTGVGANASAITGLDTRVTSAEGGITSQASDISALQTTVNDPSTGVGANASAITGLDTRVTSAEGSITSQASDITSIQASATAWRGALFMEDWPGTSALDSWQAYTAGTTPTVVAGLGLVGGSVARIGDNAGNDEWWAAHSRLVPFDPEKLYKWTLRVRRTAGTGAIYAGFAGVAADGSTLVNANGVNSHTLQHYHCIAGADPGIGTAWVTYTGYTQGHGATAGSAVVGSLSNPGGAHPDVRYIRPMVLVNYSGTAGTVEIDAFSFDDASGDVAAANEAAIQVESNARASADGLLNAEHTIKVQARAADGKTAIAGIGVAVDAGASGPASSEVAVLANQFTVLDPNGTDVTTPFVVVGGKTYIDTAVVQDASITNAKIADATINGAKIANAAVGSAHIVNAAIDNAKIANAAIDNAKIKDAAIDNAKIKDAAIDNAKIKDAAVDTLQLAGNAVTVPVALYAAYAAFSTLSTGDGWTAIPGLSISIDPEGHPVLLNIQFSGPIEGQANYMQARVVKGATVLGPAEIVLTRHTTAPGVVRRVNETFAFVDNDTAAGARQYALQVRMWDDSYNTSWTSSGSLAWVTMSALGVKR